MFLLLYRVGPDDFRFAVTAGKRPEEFRDEPELAGFREVAVAPGGEGDYALFEHLLATDEELAPFFAQIAEDSVALARDVIFKMCKKRAP